MIMSSLIDYDLMIEYLRVIIKDNLYCEDGELRIRTKLKYDVFNLLEEVDKEFINKLKKELEYEEE